MSNFKEILDIIKNRKEERKGRVKKLSNCMTYLRYRKCKAPMVISNVMYWCASVTILRW